MRRGEVSEFVAMSEFYTSDVRDLLRCQGSMADQRRIMVIGIVGNETKTFSGVVQAISEDYTSRPSRWQITMLDIE